MVKSQKQILLKKTQYLWEKIKGTDKKNRMLKKTILEYVKCHLGGMIHII